MDHEQRIVTLIANPAEPCLTPAIAERVATALGSRQTYFLSDGIACDIPLPVDGAEPIAAIDAALDGLPVDRVIQRADDRRRKALLADMDSTLILQECIDELADEAGHGPRVAEITARAMNGEIEFEAALRERVALLEGLPVSIIDKVLRERIQLMPGGRELVATMRAHGARCVIVSGGFTHFTAAIAARLGCDEHHANTLNVRDNFLDGTVAEPILGREAKLARLHQLAHDMNIEVNEIIAVGDGANDLAMLAEAGTGIALHAKPVVAAKAQHKINHGDLTALLYMQGYRLSDFASLCG